MTFNDNLSSIIRALDDINKPQYPTYETNYYVDFIELLAMFSGIDGISSGDLLDRFFGEADETHIHEYHNNTNITDEQNEITISERNDINEGFIYGLFRLIEERIDQFGDCYPFRIENDNNIVIKRDLSNCQKLYLFLLFSSSLDIFRNFNTLLTTDFETLSCIVMRLFLPNAEVKPFGKNTTYTGKAIDKIKSLAQDLHLNIKESEVSCIGPRNVQERGLDIIGWLPFSDHCQNKIVFLCQCACGKNFLQKQADTRMFENYIEFYKLSPLHTLFIPYSLINPKEERFYNSDRIFNDKGCLIFERLRILNLAKNSDEIFDYLDSKVLIEECINIHNSQIA